MDIFLNVAVLSGLFTTLAAGLVVAERLLINYGECRISVETPDGEKKFTVQGGGSLLDALLDAGVEVQNSCGGRGSCGFCKVQVGEGGGDLLPTEKPFLSRRDIASGMRLACQVRIRNDVRVEVPDFLEIVEEMVRSGTFDESEKYRFRIIGEENEPV